MTLGAADARPEPPVVTLYSRPGCHLCDVAREQLSALQRTVPFRLREVNIESDADLERRFMLEIPVIALGDEVITAAPVDLERVRAAVLAARVAD